MDKKTKALLLIEALLIVVLVVVVAMDYNGKGTEEKLVASHEAVETEVAAEPEAATEEHAAAEAEEAEAPAEEAVAEEKAEEPEAEAPAEEEEAAEEEKPAPEKAEKEAAPAPAKAEGSGEVADIIPLDNPAYEKHTKAIVQFTHKKHFDEYKISCGDCHHDDSAEPLADLKPGDPVQGCIECHSKPGKAPKPEKGAAKLSKSEELEYHTEALHENCISCHKEHNKKNKTKAAPATCGKCHQK